MSKRAKRDWIKWPLPIGEYVHTDRVLIHRDQGVVAASALFSTAANVTDDGCPVCRGALIDRHIINLVAERPSSVFDEDALTPPPPPERS